MILDPWQVIFDKAGDLADSLLHAQPKGEFDAVDFEEKIVGVVKEIASGEVDPKEDWSVIIRPVKKQEVFDAKVSKHFEIALRQAVFVRILFESHMQRIKKRYSEASQPRELMIIGEDMLFAFSCAQQHATAWRLLKEVRDKSNDARSQYAHQVKAEKKEESELLLRGLIESSLERLRPGGGWRSYIIAAQDIAKDLATTSETYALPITSNEGELSEKIQRMIWRETRLRKAYNEAAKEPLDEPVKVRKMYVNSGFEEG